MKKKLRFVFDFMRFVFYLIAGFLVPITKKYRIKCLEEDVVFLKSRIFDLSYKITKLEALYAYLKVRPECNDWAEWEIKEL